MSNEKFLNAYANLPAPERKRIVAIVDWMRGGVTDAGIIKRYVK